jgi:hypothetical protein
MLSLMPCGFGLLAAAHASMGSLRGNDELANLSLYRA